MLVKLRKKNLKGRRKNPESAGIKKRGDIDFDEDGEADLFAKIFEPEFEQFWKTHSDDAMRLIGMEEISMTANVRKK